MPLMSTCVARLGSRHSIILDPIRKQVHYGALGLMCQYAAEMVVGLDDGAGNFDALPLSKQGTPFWCVDQRTTMTSVVYDARSTRLGAQLIMEIVAPFWPQDEKTSLVPAYIVNFTVRRMDRVRWTKADATAAKKGTLRFGIKFAEATASQASDGLKLDYPVFVAKRVRTGEGGAVRIEHGGLQRVADVEGKASDLIAPLAGKWQVRDGMMEAAFDVSGSTDEQHFSLAVIGYCGDALFERRQKPMALKYTKYWKDAADVAAFVRKSCKSLLKKSATFDRIFTGSSLPAACQELTALSFQSYLMCSLWAVGQQPKEWFSVWEGSCWYNSTVDVTYNESMFYFAFWPQLLEMLFDEWSQHANDLAAEKRRRDIVSDDEKFNQGLDFEGAVMEHDMGAGWTANGQSYHHAMPVEENSNFLLMLYAHGKWWSRETLYKKYANVSRELVKYLLWADSTGNGFPDRGTANTIDDATPAVQYGRDNVYLGIKRLAALHAAARMFEHIGDADWADKCAAEVRKAVKTLNAGWLGDHWGVCLDKTAKGLVDCWTLKPLPYKVLPGWDAYSLYTTNGLLPLMMVDDLPPGISADRLKQDVVAATRESMTQYGCGHSSMDKTNMWVSMNVWRDAAAAYLGKNMLHNSERYWNLQLWANGIGSEKPNCFNETSLTNNLVWYPRNAAMFGLPMAMAGLVRRDGKTKLAPAAEGDWPLLALADWKIGDVPVAKVRQGKKGLAAKV